MMSLVRRVIVGMQLAWIMCLLIYWISGCATTPMQRTSSLTTPESFLGYKVGADYKLTTYEKATEYFELLAGQTDRMKVVDMGPTSMGKRHKYAIISSTENIKNLEHYRQIAEKLSWARDISADEAEKLAAEGKAVAWIDAGLHASECAPSEHLIQLAYDLVTDEDELTRRIRDNVITLLAYANPDGATMVADWYMMNQGTEYENSRMPWLYHLYTGHDNNRDGFNVTQKETQNIIRVQNHEWLVNVAYNHHQTAPFPTRIWIPPYGEPTNPNKPPLVVRWENLIGANMGKMFDESGRPGAVSRISFDGWYPGYMSQICTMHNAPGILTETALYRLATPHEYEPNEIRGAFSDFTNGAYYPSPWKGGWWRLADAVDYCLVASKAVLDTCARYRRDMLLSKYKIATDNIERFKKEKPYGWVIPPQQNDLTTTAKMLEKFLLHGIEIFSANEPFKNNGEEIQAGAWIIPASQPFAMYVKTMMEKQDYPDLRKYTHLWQGLPRQVDVDDKDPLRPYDVAGWTLPIQMGIDYKELKKPVDFKTTQIFAPPFPAGAISGLLGQGNYYFSTTDNNSFSAVSRIHQAGGTVSRTVEPHKVNMRDYPVGTFIAAAADVPEQEMKKIASVTHVPMMRAFGSGKKQQIRPLRLGHFKPWSSNMDEGWMRWVLEEYEIPYQSVEPKVIRAGNLNEKFNVLSFASINSSTIINGNREGSNRPEYVGGIEETGVEHLKDFVRNGGTLICNDGSCDFAIEQFNLPIKNVMSDAQKAGFYAAGSVVKMDYDNTHPVAYGMGQKGTAFIRSTHLFEIDNAAAAENQNITGDIKIVARFPDEPLLISGYLEHDETIRGKYTVLDVPYGKGKIILFGFNFHNRAQTYSAFKLFFNAMYY